MLTASYPTSSFGWAVAAKDQDVADPRTITAYAYGFSDPGDLYDVQIFSAVSGVDPTNHPAATVVLPAGYVLVGGGAQAHYGGSGQFLIASRPTDDMRGWTAASLDHIKADPGTVTAYAVGLRARAGTAAVASSANTDTTSSPVDGPEADAPPPAGTVLVGGGGQVLNDSGPGVMLTTSAPDPGSPGEWLVQGHDQQIADKTTIEAWAIGVNWGP
jgi:hypothetical protein